MKLSHKLSNVSKVSGVLSKTKLVNIESNHFINNLTHLTHNTHLFTKARAFTLAEVLITLGIVGVVAAITMPTLITNINERINSERQANIVHKITQAMEHMRALGKLTVYDSTESFVDELQNHLKIQKRCDKDHIAECWPTDRVTTNTGKNIGVEYVKTSKHLGFQNRNIETNNVGLILADGAAIILNYDVENAKSYDIGDKVEASYIGLPVGNNKSKVFQYTTSVTIPIAFVMDVNGKRGPNSETINGKYHDIRSFNGAKMDNGCIGDRYGNKCILYFGYGSYDGIDCAESNSSSDDYIKYCGPTPSGYGTGYVFQGNGGYIDRWAGAKKLCKTKDMDLTTLSDLQYIYDNLSHFISIPFRENNYKSEAWSDSEQSWASGYSFNLATGNQVTRGKYFPIDTICIMTVND